MNEVPAAPPVVKDRRGGLIVFGIVEILLGCVCLALIGFMLFGQIMMARAFGTPVQLRMVLPGLIFYLGLAVIFFVLGAGSMNCRKWARALTLIFSWPWLVVGIVTVPLAMLIIRKALATSMPQGQHLPPGALIVILTVEFVMLSLFMILIPFAFVLFYSRNNVKATCDMRDPARRWTDDRPLPTLGVSIFLWLSGIILAVFAFVGNGVLPLFGTIFSGLPGIALSVLVAALWFWIGALWYRQSVLGWWLLLLAIAAFGCSGVVTFSRIDLADLYRKFGYPEAQIDFIRQQGWMMSSALIWMAAIWVPIVVGYLLWTRRFFSGRSLPQPGSSAA